MQEALREAIINAMIHKDYNINSNIQINISPDKVEIVNPGKLLFPVKELRNRSVQRNPILVDLVHRLGLIEKAGSGIKRIKKLAKEDNVKVEFKSEMFFDTVFYRNEETNPAQSVRKASANPSQIHHKFITNSSQIRQEWILKAMDKNGKITAIDIKNKFNIHRTSAKNDLNSLIRQNNKKRWRKQCLV